MNNMLYVGTGRDLSFNRKFNMRNGLNKINVFAGGSDAIFDIIFLYAKYFYNNNVGNRHVSESRICGACSGFTAKVQHSDVGADPCVCPVFS